jgi:predicted protein tyrosine phosphatase
MSLHDYFETRKRKRADGEEPVKLVIKICDAETAFKLVVDEDQFDHVISIGNPPRNSDKHVHDAHREKRIISRNYAKVAQFYQFYDSARRTSERNRRTMYRAVSDIAAKARTFSDGARVLIHCRAGKCRSTAAAMIVLRVASRTSWSEARDAVLRIRPCARPYEEMLEAARSMGL